MTKREEYEMKTEQLLLPIMEEYQFELYDVEFVKEAGTFYLRAFIDKEGGININDCEVVSRRLSDLLDQKDFIPDAYILEVSSPGLGRTLKKDKHFEKSIGEEVEVKLFKAIDKQKEFTGYLDSFDDEKIVIADENDNLTEFERSNIAVVKLAVHF
ncbi:MAG: ribosome maturation factor RimP [Lachnospiraceae bacterium]|nr:ribosome maturation factor RimP [Lachnospiraceae bacterium]